MNERPDLDPELELEFAISDAAYMSRLVGDWFKEHLGFENAVASRHITKEESALGFWALSRLEEMTGRAEDIFRSEERRAHLGAKRVA